MVDVYGTFVSWLNWTNREITEKESYMKLSLSPMLESLNKAVVKDIENFTWKWNYVFSNSFSIIPSRLAVEIWTNNLD